PDEPKPKGSRCRTDCATTLGAIQKPTIVFCPHMNDPNKYCGWECVVFHELTHACGVGGVKLFGGIGWPPDQEKKARACTTALYPGSRCDEGLAAADVPNPKDCPGYNPPSKRCFDPGRLTQPQITR